MTTRERLYKISIALLAISSIGSVLAVQKAYDQLKQTREELARTKGEMSVLRDDLAEAKELLQRSLPTPPPAKPAPSP